MHKVGGRRNFGWGKRMDWAGKQALRAAFGGGHHGTVSSHAARWRKFCVWLKDRGIRDARQITRTELAQFTDHLAQQTKASLSVAYAKNIVTSVNVALESLRGDRAIWIKPGAVLGKRSSVRTSPPGGLDRRPVQEAVAQLIANDRARVAATALLCRELGLRRREAALLDLNLARDQASQLGRVNIIAGTKGGRGRSVDRWVPIPDPAKAAIDLAVKAAGEGSKLIPDHLSLAQWLSYVSKAWRAVANPLVLGTLRDLRAAYACDRYRQLTHAPAPAVAGVRTADKTLDRAARKTLSQELGHERIDVLAAYVGSSK